jgi:two-component system sensor histidine kinase BaeS
MDNPLRSLAVKLTLAFLFVGLIGALSVAYLVRLRTQRAFDRLIVDQNQQVLVTNLTRYYQANGSWVGIESIFRVGQGESPPVPGPGARWEARRSLFTIANADGTIVYGGGGKNPGDKLPPSALRTGVPMEVEGERIGWLLFTPAIDRWRPGTPEGDFLLGVNRAIFLSALLAAGIALVLGGILAFTMTRSLRELTVATQVLAEGKLGHQVKVRSRDELGVLADSFNRMSSALARANELRRRMTADIAHDLRSPLSVILGYTEALSDEKLQATPEMLEVMHTEARHLSHLVDDLKTLALADAGELPLNRQRISPGVLLKRAADAHRVNADREQVEIRLSVPLDLPDVEVDVDRMAQVLGNLLSNALRYTPADGEITLSAVRKDGRVRLRVADNGAGIPAGDLPYIFERSYRGDRARQHQAGETGLGLAIAKSLVEAQGGTISVESALGAGTTFIIQFPACEEASRPLPGG